MEYHKILNIVPVLYGRTLLFIHSIYDSCVGAKLLQSCPTLCDSMDYSPLGFSVHGILQARILEWVAMPSSRDSSQPRGLKPHVLHLLHWQEGSLPLMPPGSPCIIDVC